MKIVNNLTELIGNTPMMYLSAYSKAVSLEGVNLIGKLEYFNPLGSVKDRAALSMIEDAEKRGELKQGSVIIEPTSGNTGIGLAFVSTIKGYRIILTMPDSMSLERRNLLMALGAELVLTPGAKGMKGAIAEAEKLASELPDSFIPGQFTNPANPRIHISTTAEEIWRDTDGQVDIFVAGAGTGGTITGVGEGLKSHSRFIKIVAVEPYDSPVLSGGEAGPHKLQGIGAGFVPTVLNVKILDEIIKVKANDAFETARTLAQTEGLLVGISGGAALYAGTQLAKRKENIGKNIVVLLPDSGERYLSSELF
ncbi:cysteine synthase A [Anaerovorax odorimutans]|uniref:cysteine synthase A n=1 Tax=Anaerovorax odorimutans TaxID=109327 RepID=UPI000416B924|nr:cysteine synthase A [Anaerovorax odorimutans]